MTPRRPPGQKRAGKPAAAPDDAALFRREMQGVAPVRAANRVEPYREKPAPIPAKRIEDEHAVLEELARLGLGGDDCEFEDNLSYLRPGLPRDILRKLRRTHWVIQRDLDLHGMTGDAAALAAARFLADCRRSGLRCVRIVHGKGLRSPGREPVLKGRIRKMLTRRSEVLAFVEPHAVDGGGGAVIVLLEA